jgi:hypothetical protein
MQGLRQGLQQGTRQATRQGLAGDFLSNHAVAAQGLVAGISASVSSVNTATGYAYGALVRNSFTVDVANVTGLLTLPVSSSFVSSNTSGGWTVVNNGDGTVSITTSSLARNALAPTVTVNVTSPTSIIGGTALTATFAASGVLAPVSTATKAITLKTIAETDGTSLKYVPMTNAEWTSLGITAPTSIWPLQELTGTLGDQNGVLNLSPSGSLVAYQRLVPGWSQVGVGNTATGLGKVGGFFNTAQAVAFDQPGSSVAFLSYLQLNAVNATAASTCIELSSSVLVGGTVNAPTPHLRSSGGQMTEGLLPVTGSVHPFVLVWDRTHRTTDAYTDGDHMVGTFADLTGTGIAIGPVFGALAGGSMVDSTHVFAAAWTGSIAETMSTNAVRSMLTQLGWKVTAW